MRWIIISLLTVCVVGGGVFAWKKYSRVSALHYNSQVFKHEFVIVQAHQLLGFSLVDPEQAPPEIRARVMRGYDVFMNTPFYASHFGHNELSCSNCHFSGGDTIGGKNGGISLVGVTTSYPQFSKRANKVITLEERINNCFQRSMNGVAPPPNSNTMLDLVEYLKWISKEVESIKDIPWLGLPEIKNSHQPDPKNGELLYEKCCASCHRSDGEGGGMISEVDGKSIPPLWGEYSFNDGAGMGTIKMFAPFIYLNMPYQQARLTEEEALDISAYVLQKPRPHFQPVR